MPKAPKMAGGGLGSAVSHPAGGQEAKPLKNFDFFHLNHGETKIVKVKIQFKISQLIVNLASVNLNLQLF